MITNTGKNIIGKYLLGQAPAYASYVAIGCGPKPLATADPFGNYAAKANLDFEMFRVPISSRGFVNEGGIDKIVLTAELPTAERYEITEVGIYSAGANPSAGSNDSKTILSFSTTENWQYHSGTTATAITSYTNAISNGSNVINVTDAVFQANADNPTLSYSTRLARYERPRFLNNVIFMRGNDANLSIVSNSIVIGAGSNHIHNSGSSFDFSKNSPTDELRLAFSIINKDGASTVNPDSAIVLVEFASDESPTAEYARFEVNLDDASVDPTINFAANRYYVVKKQLQQLKMSSGFSWNKASIVKIYSSVIKNGSVSSDYYIALDAMRLENTTTTNPLYGLTGYTVVKTDNAVSIVKSPNTNNYIEFRFTLGVT
jgi:hypothetical protein